MVCKKQRNCTKPNYDPLSLGLKYMAFIYKLQESDLYTCLWMSENTRQRLLLAHHLSFFHYYGYRKSNESVLSPMESGIGIYSKDLLVLISK